MRFILALLLTFVATAASADITIRNFNGFSTGTVATVMKYDDGNNAVDAHDGMILQVSATSYYLIGTSYSCGFEYLNPASSFCGFNVYSSTDLGFNKKWHLEGKLFDASPAFWQSRCGGGNGCFEVKAIFNPTTSKYVFWFNQAGTVTSPDNEQVFTCSTPTCGATPTVPGSPTFQTEPHLLAHGPVSSSQALFVDTDNSCYLFYNDGVGARSNWIEKLNSTCTDSAGVSSVDTNVKGEGSGFFLASGKYYALSGSLCAYCSGGATTVYSSASSVSGTYSASTQISTISCNGQIQSVNTIVAGGISTYLYAADQWTGSNAEGGATIYYKPLTFTAGAIDALTCDTTVTVAGVTPDAIPSPAVPSNADQTSVAIGYHDTCDLRSTNWRMQTFVPTAVTSLVYMPLAKNIVTGNLTVSLVTVDGSNNPVTTLWSKTYTPSDINSAGTWTAIPIHAPTPGSTYGIVLSSTASAGCYSVPVFFGTFTNPYSTGVERFSTNSGSTWTTETSRALMFATVPPIAGAGRFPFRH